MTTVVTGSTGHLGEALVRTLRADGESVIGVDMRPGPYTDRVGRIEDIEFARDVLTGARSVLHAATLLRKSLLLGSWHDDPHATILQERGSPARRSPRCCCKATYRPRGAGGSLGSILRQRVPYRVVGGLLYAREHSHGPHDPIMAYARLYHVRVPILPKSSRGLHLRTSWGLGVRL